MDAETSRNNERVHIRSLVATKLGDGLVDPKLVLAWLLTYVGAGPLWVGLLVPIREAGALLPQLFTAEKLRTISVRKWWWVTGSFIQGAAVLGMVMAGLLLSGELAGLTVIGCLTVFALARSICSVSYKDVLGKTIEKKRRGTITGTAASFAAIGVFIFGLLLMFSVIEREALVFGALSLAAILWITAALQFSKLNESPSDVSNTDTESVWKRYFAYLSQDRELQKFIFARALLTATAVAPPFLLLLSTDSGSNLLNQLGALVVASAFATTVSGYIWGKLSDYSTKAVLGIAGFMSGFILFGTLFVSALGYFSNPYVLPGILFVLIVLYRGVRIARTVHLVNLANEETRAAYTAISNTIIGVVLLGTGLFGVLAVTTGVPAVIAVLSAMSILGGVVTSTFKTVQ